MKRTVLVVDDQPLVREVLKSILEARGISVAVAKDGAEALERFAADSIPAVVIDVDMPGPNGVEVCRAVRAFAADHRRPVAVWLMTGVERPGLVARAQAAGALGVLAKPFSTAELLARIEEMFGRLSAAA